MVGGLNVADVDVERGLVMAGVGCWLGVSRLRLIGNGVKGE